MQLTQPPRQRLNQLRCRSARQVLWWRTCLGGVAVLDCCESFWMLIFKSMVTSQTGQDGPAAGTWNTAPLVCGWWRELSVWEEPDSDSGGNTGSEGECVEGRPFPLEDVLFLLSPGQSWILEDRVCNLSTQVIAVKSDGNLLHPPLQEKPQEMSNTYITKLTCGDEGQGDS